MTHEPDTDRARLSAHYSHLRSDDHARRWSLDNPGNQAAYDEREAFFGTALAGLEGLASSIDLGCGSASIVPGLEGSFRIGVDILFERLVEEQHLDIDSLVHADGARLPIRSGSVDAVLMFTMLSSVTNTEARSAIAEEVARVLRPGGVVVWYDMRYPSPGNREMHPIPAREIARLFPGFDRRLRSLTLLPPLSRRLGRFTEKAHPALSRIPFLRSHLAGTLVKR